MFWEWEFHFGNGNSQNSKIILGMEISIPKMIFEFCEFPFPLFPILFREFPFPKHLCFSGVSRNFLWGPYPEIFKNLPCPPLCFFPEIFQIVGEKHKGGPL